MLRFIDYACLAVIALSAAGIVALKATHAQRPAALEQQAIVQELPDAVLNAPPQRLAGPDGAPLIDHSAGW